jgi:hypothetical protein
VFFSMKRLLQLFVILSLLTANTAFAALSASTVFEIRSTATASNVNGGGFNAANANLLTDGAATSATGNAAVFSSASYNFVAGDVDAWIYIKTGTNWNPVCYYKITSVASNVATLDSSAGAGVCVSNNRFTATTSAGVASVASPTGATWGIDYSQQDAAKFADTDLASTNGTTSPCAVTSAANPFSVKDVGNLLHVTAGTSWTQGWYEIVSVSGSTATLDRACGSAATLSNGTAKMGGALSLGSSDDAVFELGVSSTTAAARYFIKGSATYTINGAVAVAAAGNAAWPFIYEGFATLRGDAPTGSTRPTLALAANAWTGGSAADYKNIIFTTTTAAGVTFGGNNKSFNCKIVNSSTTAARVAATISGTSNVHRRLEAVSYRGSAVSLAATNTFLADSYIHDSDKGIVTSGNQFFVIRNNIIAANITAGIDITAAAPTTIITIEGNTLYGSEAKIGTGLNIVTASRNIHFRNNIVYGFATGVSHPDVNTVNYDDYNNYFNNTNDVNDVTKWQKGANDLALDPTFTSVAQLSGATATTSGSVLTQSGGDFSTVVDGRDYLYLVSGTGVTAGIYGITSHTSTTVTLDIAPGTNATADKVWKITTGRNFAIGTNLKAGGYPGVFAGGYSTGYQDIGAVQRQESGGINYSRIFGGF